MHCFLLKPTVCQLICVHVRYRCITPITRTIKYALFHWHKSTREIPYFIFEHLFTKWFSYAHFFRRIKCVSLFRVPILSSICALCQIPYSAIVSLSFREFSLLHGAQHCFGINSYKYFMCPESTAVVATVHEVQHRKTSIGGRIRANILHARRHGNYWRYITYTPIERDRCLRVCVCAHVLFLVFGSTFCRVIIL